MSDAAEFGLDYEAVLKDLLLWLHRIALAQADPAPEGVSLHLRSQRCKLLLSLREDFLRWTGQFAAGSGEGAGPTAASP